MLIDSSNVNVSRNMNYKYFVIVASMTAVLIGATALATADSAFAGGKEKNQATTSANACGNDELPTNVGCQNTNSQTQGDENSVAITSQQTFPEFELEEEPPSAPNPGPPSAPNPGPPSEPIEGP
jgi:hypothetical protein